MHSRDRREFGRRKMRIRNKWEVVLVLTVIAAGIVITTVAAIKAKERRQLHVESKSSHKTNKSSVSHVREVSDNHSGDQTNRDQNRKRITPLDTKIVKKVADTQPDYDVEYDLVKSGPEEYTALASESIDSIPRNRLRIAHDGLPGFPPPQGISNQYNSDVELSADAAGFVLESVDQTNGESAKDQVEYRDVISKPSDLKTNSEFKSIRTNKLKHFIKNENQRNNNNNNINNNNNNNINNNNNNNNNQNNEKIVTKSEPKRIPMVPIFVDPPKEVLESNIRLTSNKASEPKPDMKIAIPVKIMSRLPINKERVPNLGASDSMRIALPNLEPAIRILGLSDQFHHSGEFLAPALQAAIDNIPVNMRRFILDGDKQETIHSINSNGKSVPKIRSKRESERRFILRQYKPSHSTTRDQLKDSEPKTGESRYIPISERSFIPEDREDNDGEDSETELESDDESVRSLFNFDDLENRFPSVLSSPKETKRNDDNYSTDESRNKQKYGILGSGNFEIIRGGIYAEDESATDNVPNYVSDSDSDGPQMESDSNEQKTDQTEPENQSQFETSPQSDPNSDDDNESNRFSPFNIDFFTGTPILGFQGYDNFGATSVDKYKAPAPSPIRSSVKVNGQRRHFYDPFSADSNLHVIATDEDLYSDS